MLREVRPVDGVVTPPGPVVVPKVMIGMARENANGEFSITLSSHRSPARSGRRRKVVVRMVRADPDSQCGVVHDA